MNVEPWQLGEYVKTTFEAAREFNCLRQRPTYFMKSAYFMMFPDLITIDTGLNDELFDVSERLSIRVGKLANGTSMSVCRVAEVMSGRETSDNEDEGYFKKLLPYHFVLRSITKCVWNKNRVEVATHAILPIVADENTEIDLRLNEESLRALLSRDELIIPEVNIVSLTSKDVTDMRLNFQKYVEALETSGKIKREVQLQDAP